MISNSRFSRTWRQQSRNFYHWITTNWLLKVTITTTNICTWPLLQRFHKQVNNHFPMHPTLNRSWLARHYVLLPTWLCPPLHSLSPASWLGLRPVPHQLPSFYCPNSRSGPNAASYWSTVRRTSSTSRAPTGGHEQQQRPWKNDRERNTLNVGNSQRVHCSGHAFPAKKLNFKNLLL